MRLVPLTLLGLLASAGCSESNLQIVQEPPPVYEQPEQLGYTTWQDQFQQRTVVASDILFAVDGSGSMSDEQAQLESNFQNFITGFVNTNLDYHIGVVDLDLEGSEDDWGILREYNGERWIHPSTPDKEAAFEELALVGADGAGTCEMGLQASFSALNYQSHPGRPNEGFYREDALLSVIVLSDEKDHGGTSDPLVSCDGLTADEYISWLRYFKGAHGSDEIFFTGIVGPPGGCGDAAEEGEGYWDVIDEFGEQGNFLSVCSGDWGEFLTALGFQAAGLKNSFYLRRVPEEDTLVVKLYPPGDDEGFEPSPSTWSYDRVTNSVNFPDLDDIPEALTVVEVTYRLVEDQGSQLPDGDDSDSGG